MKITSPPGVFDIIPNPEKDKWRDSYLWQYIKETIYLITQIYGYKEISTPILERAELFQRGVGQSTDIVSKEMYLFEDKGGRTLCLRPEGTAAVMRAFVENHLANQGSNHKLFYISPMFRYDRPQAGRYRQHHQFGVEAIGVNSPQQDVEIIDLLMSFYQKIGLKNLTILINSLGTKSCRDSFRKALIDYLTPLQKKLSEDSLKRLKTNPLRILDSKALEDQEIIKNAPNILEYLDSESKAHFNDVISLLKQLNLPFKVSPTLVRGLDYYNNTVFEVVTKDIGAQSSIGGGGRYDGLLKTLGGPDLPTIGFGTGIERVLQTLINQNASLPKEPAPFIYIAPLGEQSRKFCFNLLKSLRDNQIPSLMDFSGKKLNKVMQEANALQANYAIVIGDNEITSNNVDLKNMETGKKQPVSLTELVSFLTNKWNQQQLLRFWKKIQKTNNQHLSKEDVVKQFNKSVKETQNLAQTIKETLNELKDILE